MSGPLLFANNAVSTLAGAISNVATTAVLATGSGALFPTPLTGQYFCLTFTDAATGLLHEIVHVTAISGDTITMVRAQENTTALNWLPGDLADNLWTAGSATAMQQSSSLTGNLNLYVATTGSDSNNGLSPSTPFLTLQHAWNTIIAGYSINGYTVNVNVADGTYTAGVNAFGSPLGTSSEAIQFIGNTGTPDNCVISVTNSNCFAAAGGANIGVQGFKVAATGSAGPFVTTGCGLYTPGQGGIIFGNMDFGTCSIAHILAFGLSSMSAGGFPYTITGSAPAHIYSQQVSSVDVSGSSVTLTGTPAFSAAFVVAQEVSEVSAENVVFTGSATGIRYDANNNGCITTSGGGASYFPGSTAGVTASGGQYT